MAKRKKTSPNIETDILYKCARRCCLCYGLDGDYRQKQGQIAHLDGNPSNSAPDNLAYLCLPHHDQYDSKTSQSKGLTIGEVKKYRKQLYDIIAQRREKSPTQPEITWPSNLEVPKLTKIRQLDPTRGISTPGIQLIDKDPTGKEGHPWLYLSIYFKTSRFFGGVSENEKWLYFEAHMRPALSLRIQVRAWNNRDVFELMDFLRDPNNEFISGYNLQGPEPESKSNKRHSGDYFLVWREDEESRLMISTFTATNAGVSIHARLSDEVMKEWAKYLEDVGFAEPFKK